MAIKSPLINVMVSAVHKAARLLVRDFGEVEQLQVSRKGPADFVSTADQRSERILHEELQRARPGFGFLLEERGMVRGTDVRGRRWIIDPLDGTTNFLHGIPHWAISVALEDEGQLVAGVVYNPISDETFVAERGKGAFLNDRRLRVSGRRELRDCLLATGAPFLGHGDPDRFTRELERLLPLVSGVRRFGSAALDLAWVAAGRYDGFWERGLKPWDVGAGIILVREAGGFATEIGGGESPLDGATILAANPAIHPLLDEHVKA